MVADDAVKTILSEAVNEGTDMVTLYYAVVAQSFLGIKGITVYILKTSNDMFQCVSVVFLKKNAGMIFHHCFRIQSLKRSQKVVSKESTLVLFQISNSE